MYAFTIIETDTSYQARITRIMLEAAGYPTIAVSLKVEGRDAHCAITAAPTGAPEQFSLAVNMYAEYGERGVEHAVTVSELPSVKAQRALNPRAVPEALAGKIRNALLQTLFTSAEAEGVTVVTSEPNYSTLTTNHDPGDEDRVPTPVTDAPTAPVASKAERNPAGGGFDGPCQGADRWDNFKPSRDIFA